MVSDKGNMFHDAPMLASAFLLLLLLFIGSGWGRGGYDGEDYVRAGLSKAAPGATVTDARHSGKTICGWVSLDGSQRRFVWNRHIMVEPGRDAWGSASQVALARQWRLCETFGSSWDGALARLFRHRDH